MADQEDEGLWNDEPLPFSVKKHSGERIDGFDTGSAWYYIFQILLITYGIGCIASFSLIANAQIEHTYHKANNNGALYSDRYVSLHWLAIFLWCVKPLIFATVCSLLLYRNTTCCGNKASGCTAFWISVLVVLVLADLISFGILSSFWSKCNSAGQVGNPCNSLKWCCATEIYTESGNLCSNTAACSPAVTLAELTPNVDFVWTFSVAVAFAAFDLFFLMLPIGLWLANHSSPDDSASKVDGDAELLKDDAPPFLFSKMPSSSPAIVALETRKRRVKARLLVANPPKMTKQQ